VKVAMVETGGWGGIAHYTWNLSKALAEQGVEVALLTNGQYELHDLPTPFIVERCLDGQAGYLRNARTLWKQIAKLAPDIVHVQSLLSTRLDGILWRLVSLTTPLVLTEHNVQLREGSDRKNWTQKQCYRAANEVIVHTQEGYREMQRYVRSTTHVTVIHHGDYGFFEANGVVDRCTARRMLELPADAKIILAFGAIRPYKGIHDLIEMLPAVRRRHANALLVVAGPLLIGAEEEYRAAIARAGMQDAVAFWPHYVPHADVAVLFHAADVAVFNYHDITDSGALRVACSLGTPVVATAVGGFREFLKDRETARLVSPGNLDALAGAVGDVLDDPAAAERMACAAQALSGQRWSWESAARATLVAYHAAQERTARHPFLRQA
jgi:glycosyltransferase involved in cell wall biosynthesis